MLWSLYALGTRTRLWFGHGRSGQRRLWENERDNGLGMRLWFGHGCSGQRMLLEHERDYGSGMDALVIVGMDALVIVCSGNTNEIMVWAWTL